MAPETVRRSRLDAGVALDPRLLAVVVPASLVTSVLTRPLPDVPAVVAWTVANVASLSVTGVWVLVVRAVVLRRASLRSIGSVALVLIGASVGLLKGASTSTFGWTVGLVDDPTAVAERWRWVSTTVQGVVLLPAVALTGAALARYRVEYERLIVERARRVLLEGRSAAGEQGARVARFVTEARRRLDEASDPTVATVLEELVEERLRPLTRELWTTSSEPTDFTLRSLVRAALHTDAYPALPVATVYVITAFASQAQYAPLAANVLATTLDLVAIVALFAIARRSRLPARWDVAQLLVTLLVTTAVIVTIEHVVIGAGASGLDPVATGFIVLVWIGFLTLLSSAVLIALRTRGHVREELERLLDDGLGFDVEDASRRLRDRETADLLHSGMQNRLIAAARRIESAGSRADVVRDEVAAVGRLLDELASGAEGPARPASVQVEELVARWHGFVTIDVALDDTLDTLPQPLQDRIAQAVAEAVNNAVRHGRAAHVRARLVAGTGPALRLEVDDDGVGPVERPAGLGSRLFHALSAGSWELSAREDGGSRLSVPIVLDAG
jgi:hypothetical protein